MKPVTEITREEFEAMKKHHKLTSYTNADIAELINLTRMYVDKHISSCSSCSNNMREAKNKLNSFYLHHKDAIEKRLNGPVEEANELDSLQLFHKVLNEPIKENNELEEAKKQVKEYSKKRKKKDDSEENKG